MNTSAKQLSFENLESRELLAGNVTVSESNDLRIRGDEHDNEIQIIAWETGQIAIRGQNGTTVNGSLDPLYLSNAQDLNGVNGRNALFEGRLFILTGDGDDRVDIWNLEFSGNSRINAGQGHDSVRLHKSTARNDLVIGTGEGHDSVVFSQSRAKGDLTVRTFSGKDSVRVHNTRTWGDTRIVTGADHDEVKIVASRLTGDSHVVLTKGGRDYVDLKLNTINDSGLTVLTGHGRDQVFAALGRGDNVTGEVFLNGQQGYDFLSLRGSQAMKDQVRFSSFEYEGEMLFDNGDGGFEIATYAVSSFLDTPNENHRVDLQLDTTQTIRQIAWTGTYGSDLIDPLTEAYEIDDFTIEIFEENELMPVGVRIASDPGWDKTNDEV